MKLLDLWVREKWNAPCCYRSAPLNVLSWDFSMKVQKTAKTVHSQLKITLLAKRTKKYGRPHAWGSPLPWNSPKNQAWKHQYLENFQYNYQIQKAGESQCANPAKNTRFCISCTPFSKSCIWQKWILAHIQRMATTNLAVDVIFRLEPQWFLSTLVYKVNSHFNTPSRLKEEMEMTHRLLQTWGPCGTYFPKIPSKTSKTSTLNRCAPPWTLFVLHPLDVHIFSCILPIPCATSQGGNGGLVPVFTPDLHTVWGSVLQKFSYKTNLAFDSSSLNKQNQL